MNKLCRIEIWFWKLIELEDISVEETFFVLILWLSMVLIEIIVFFFVLPCQKDFVPTEHLNAPEQTLL